MVRSLYITLSFATLASIAILIIVYAYLSNNGNRLDRFNRNFIAFWYNDVPPMDDTCRIILYGGLLVISLLSFLSQPHLGDSPLQAPELYAYTLPEYFLLMGFMQAVPRALLTLRYVRRIRSVCVIAWICSILGFGGTWSYALVALCALILHGITTGCTGVNHRWYAPVYMLLALALSHGNSSFSVDHYFASRYHNYPFVTPSSTSLLMSGFGRKVALALSLSTLFFGGISKLTKSGIRWMDGKTLAFHLSDDSVGQWRSLKVFVVKCKYFSILLSVVTIVFQLGAPCALFIPMLRTGIIALAMMFHLGIWLTMYPNYLPQTWCYLVGLSIATATTSDQQNYIPVNVTTLCGAWIITGLLLFLTICTLMGIEHWPLTSVSMYSLYRNESYSHHYFVDVDQILHVSKECLDSSMTELMPCIYLRLFNSTNKSYELDELVFQNCFNQGVLPGQWKRIQTIIAAYDVLVKSSSQLKQDLILNIPSSRPAEIWLWKNIHYWRSKHWCLPMWTFRRDVEVQLVARMKSDTALVLASIPWLEK